MKVTKFNAHTLATDYAVTLMGGTSMMLPAVTAMLTTRVGAWPLVSGVDRPGRKLTLGISIEGADVDTLRAQLFRWFDPEDETPKALTVTDDDDSDERYMDVVCEALQPESGGDRVIGTLYVATLAVHGDVRWRGTADVTDTWAITASGQTKSISNGGTDDAYPVFQITPTSVKAGGYLYRRWVPITWVTHGAAQQYPGVAILDTSIPIGASKMQADGDDLRVFSDGIEIYRWLDAASWNGAASKVWFNLNFSPAQIGTLKTDIASSGDITAIELNEDVTAWPASGIVLIGTEAFVFTGKDTSLQVLSGITRAAKGTSMAAHAIAATVTWIQHDVWILYGNATAAAPTVDDDYKPAFELDHSTNGSWVYEKFGQQDVVKGSTVEYQSGRWQRWGNITLSPSGGGGCYTATQRSRVVLESPFLVAGAWIYAECGSIFGWDLENPCGITNAAWTNGLKRRSTTVAGFDYLCHAMNLVRGDSSWTYMYTIPSPTNPNAWEAWSYSGAAFDVSDAIGLALYWHPSDVEVGDVTVTLNAAGIPTVTVNAEQATYSIAATLTNSTTVELIKIAFECGLNQTLEIDTYNKTVKYLKDNSSQFQALTFVGAVRRNWLRLQPLANTLKYEDTGTAGVTLVTKFRKRYY